MKRSSSCSFLLRSFSRYIARPHFFRSLPVTIALLFPSSHTVRTLSPLSTTHTHTHTHTSSLLLYSASLFDHPFRLFCLHFPPCFLSPLPVTSIQFVFSRLWTILMTKYRAEVKLFLCVLLYSLPSPDLDFRYFWKWSAFEDYLLFCFGFTVLCAVITLLLLDSALFVETLGSLAVMFEAMLGLPQLLQNFHNHSTKGMRYRTLWGQAELCRKFLTHCTTIAHSHRTSVVLTNTTWKVLPLTLMSRECK